MIISSLNVTVNNQSNSEITDPVIITNSFPTFNWSFSPITGVIPDEHTGLLTDIIEKGQYGYEIRISTSNINLGTDRFVGNRIQTDFVVSKDRFWNYRGVPLERGLTYYGQIYIQDDIGRLSDWVSFSFHYNNLPFVSSIGITPVSPTVNDNIVLSYSFNDEDGDHEQGTIIRWFKNGAQQKQFDNITIIKSEFLQINDVWFADILPSDEYEYGERASSPWVKVSKVTITVDEIQILPLVPNENDILKADYIFSDTLEQNNAVIRWFINGSLNNKFNDMQYIRPVVAPGDTVRYEVRPNNGITFVSSNEITISYSNFIVYNIKIDNQEEPLEVSTIKPIVSWETRVPKNKEINYISIKIGTFYEANNIYSEIINTNKNNFSIPANLLNKGEDYYISIAVSDTTSFNKYSLAHFRIRGSRWEEAVNNSTGWTIETLFIIDNSNTTFDESLYQVIRFSDGTKFGEVKIYNQKISFISTEIIFSDIIDISGINVLTIVGKDEDILIYINSNLIINGTGKFTQASTEKKLEIGNDTGKDFTVNYKYFFYTVSGGYSPDISEEYSNIQFYVFIEFNNNEIVSLKGYTVNNKDYKLFGVNPDETEESGSMYFLMSNDIYKNTTVNRTFSPINNIKISPDKTKVVFAHAKGATVITGYEISNYDYDLDFTGTEENVVTINYEQQTQTIYPYPENNGWALIQNLGRDAAYFNDSGLNIDTINKD